MLVYNRDHRVFLGERFGEPGIWQFPQGGVEESQSLEENVYRELDEELGVAPPLVQITKRLDATHTYVFAKPPTYAKGIWQGQSQTFWLVAFLGTDQQFNFNKHSPEFQCFCWCTPEEVRLKAEARRLPGYEAPLKEFEAFLASTSVP